MKCNIKMDQKWKSEDRRQGKCYCERSNGPWDFVKLLEFLDYVNICYCLNIYCAAGSEKKLILRALAYRICFKAQISIKWLWSPLSLTLEHSPCLENIVPVWKNFTYKKEVFSVMLNLSGVVCRPLLT